MQEDSASKGAGKDDQPDTFILKPTKADPSKASCIAQISVNPNRPMHLLSDPSDRWRPE